MFSASWCGPCQAYKRKLVPGWLETLSNFRVIEIPERWNFDEMSPQDREIVDRFKVRSIPSVIAVDGVVLMDRSGRFSPIAEIIKKYGKLK